jgi:hypothetical protein
LRKLQSVAGLTEQRIIRGYGAGSDPQGWPKRPDNNVAAVRAWLAALLAQRPRI